MTESGVEHPEIVSDGEKPEDELATTEESITEPGKVLRIGSMVKQLLEEFGKLHLMRRAASDLPRYTSGQ